ncbi:MFS transporter [Streptomyces sp. CT34]|uniref:MFS transporter n=1 Tax=Streptomyces sp. CT34 TaxID=1553907 RepID=UPI00068DBD9B|nr:MFS transporter [Streptomyces sp. CT34]
MESCSVVEAAGAAGVRQGDRKKGRDSGRRRWAFAGLSIISFLGCIDLTIVNTAAPDIQRDMGATVTELQLIVNVFVVALSMFMVTMGRLADRHGRRRVLYSGTAVFGIASLAAGFAGDVRMLIVCRFVQGAACAVLYTSTGALVADTFPEEQRGKAIGALYGVNGVGLAIGPMLGGFVVGWLDWRWVFWLNVPLVVVGLAMCFSAVRESRGGKEREDRKGRTGTAGRAGRVEKWERREFSGVREVRRAAEGEGGVLGGAERMDWIGLALISFALPAVILGLTLGDAWGWASGRILALLGLGAAGIVAFCFVERKVAAPLIDFRLFGNRMFLGAITADFSLAFFYCLAFFLMPLFLFSVRHYQGTASGLMLLPCTAVMALLSPVVGRLADRFPPRRLLCVGFAAFALSAVLQAQFTRDSGTGFIVLAFSLMGSAGRACSDRPRLPRCRRSRNGWRAPPSARRGPFTTWAVRSGWPPGWRSTAGRRGARCEMRLPCGICPVGSGWRGRSPIRRRVPNCCVRMRGWTGRASRRCPRKCFCGAIRRRCGCCAEWPWWRFWRSGAG